MQLTAALVGAPPCRPSARHSERCGVDPERIVPPRLATVLPDVLAEHVHILCASRAYEGTALPLMVTTGEQNSPLTDGESWRRIAQARHGQRRRSALGAAVATAQDLAQRPGTSRSGAAHRARVPADDEDARPTTSDPVAGWRARQVIGSWLPRVKEPWLLATPTRCGAALRPALGQ